MQSLTGLNSKFSCSQTSCHIKVKDPKTGLFNFGMATILEKENFEFKPVVDLSYYFIHN